MQRNGTKLVRRSESTFNIGKRNGKCKQKQPIVLNVRLYKVVQSQTKKNVAMFQTFTTAFSAMIPQTRSSTNFFHLYLSLKQLRLLKKVKEMERKRMKRRAVMQCRWRAYKWQRRRHKAPRGGLKGHYLSLWTRNVAEGCARDPKPPFFFGIAIYSSSSSSIFPLSKSERRSIIFSAKIFLDFLSRKCNGLPTSFRLETVSIYTVYIFFPMIRDLDID